MAMRGEDWTRAEVEAAVADYFVMLSAELSGQPFNKLEHNRALQKLIGRTHGSIERKHQNISAVLRLLGVPWIDGYKPLGHAQTLLTEVVLAGLADDKAGALSRVEQVIESPIVAPEPPSDLAGIQVQPPQPADSSPGGDSAFVPRPPKVRDYLAMEAANSALGRAGEEFTLYFERRRLWDAGRHDLSNLVEHTALTRGDGLGFDVQSFEVNGSSRVIEVKTTNFGRHTPFYLSANEVAASDRLAASYQLYRVFGFRKAPRFFALRGSVSQTCRLSPDRYLARCSAKPN